MIKNNKNGFTLVELLAVIVILAIILVIAVPKVMSVIKDAKKATLESTAKMIASAAEKQKVQNTILGKTETITCDSVSKINKLDYDTCDIEFEDNTAKVTIKGKGKFEGLYVCNGTKTSAETEEEDCLTEYGHKYITKLLANESQLNNGLMQTYATYTNDEEEEITVDAGIRYVGANPKNKVYFNCKDEDINEISYGVEGYDYQNSCEIWRIIGVFNTKTSTSELVGTPRIKIVRDEFPINMSWDSSATSVNRGYGINQWGISGDYQGADLMKMLNGYYVGIEGTTCKYCDAAGQETCSNDCSSIAPLSSTSIKMIDNVVWNLGVTSSGLLQTLYKEERESNTEMFCATSIYCTDTVSRTTEWVGKVGLIYMSDYGYASTNSDCEDDIWDNCVSNNWLSPSSGVYSTMTINKGTDEPPGIWVIYSDYTGNTASSGVWDFDVNNYTAIGVRPALYLGSKVQIIGGNGDNEPYKLSVQ